MDEILEHGILTILPLDDEGSEIGGAVIVTEIFCDLPKDIQHRLIDSWIVGLENLKNTELDVPDNVIDLDSYRP